MRYDNSPNPDPHPPPTPPLTPAPTRPLTRYDIEFAKACGFNMIRKHIKVEPSRWYCHYH